MLSIKVLIIQETNRLVQKVHLLAWEGNLAASLKLLFLVTRSSPGKYLKIWYFSELFWAIIAVFHTDLFTA